MSKNRILFSPKELRVFAENFYQELVLAHEGKNSSLSFLKTPLPQNPPEIDGDLQVVAIGGTNFHSAIYRKANSFLKPDNFVKRILPKLHSKEILFEFILNEIDPHISYLALNFAYFIEPCIRENRLDGKLLFSGKEHRFQGLKEQLIGNQLEIYAKDTYSRNIKVSIANDTICTLLAGMLTHKPAPEDSIATIMGTGSNTSFFHKEGASDYAVNLESGSFDKFEIDEVGEKIILESNTPNLGSFEKVTAGGYLYKHYNEHNQSRGHTPLYISSTEELEQLARLKHNPLAKDILERSAQLYAISIAGILRFKQEQKNIDQLNVTIEGSLLTDAYNYIENTYITLEKLGISRSDLNFQAIQRSYLVGGKALYFLDQINK